MSNDKQREAFEAWAKSSPYEFEVARFGNNCAWPGNYKAYHVQCAWEAYQAAQQAQWQPIDTAPRDGRTIMLGYRNNHGNWRTMRGQWFTKQEIEDNWEDGDLFDAGWYETSVEADVAPSCWPTNPTHWMPLPPEPKR